MTSDIMEFQLKTAMESNVVAINSKELDWRNCKLLGQGSNGKVFQVTWNQPGCGDVIVATKQSNDMDLNEIKLLMQLKHENIVGCYGYVIDEPTSTIVMEYAPNGSLDRYLAEQAGIQLPIERFQTWCLNLAHGVEYIHEKDFVHRDIKAPNVLISDDMKLKLCDFHDARVLQTTVSTEARGSIPWMAPEVMSKRKFSKKSDVYSLAVVFWQLLTGEVPFAKFSAGIQIMYRVCEFEDRPTIPAGCPETLATLLKDCWQTDWSLRPSISQVLATLPACFN